MLNASTLQLMWERICVSLEYLSSTQMEQCSLSKAEQKPLVVAGVRPLDPVSTTFLWEVHDAVCEVLKRVSLNEHVPCIQEEHSSCVIHALQEGASDVEAEGHGIRDVIWIIQVFGEAMALDNDPAVKTSIRSTFAWQHD